MSARSGGRGPVRPNLAGEIASGLPAGTVVASTDAELAADVAALLGSDQFRVYTNPTSSVSSSVGR